MRPSLFSSGETEASTNERDEKNAIKKAKENASPRINWIAADADCKVWQIGRDSAQGAGGRTADAPRDGRAPLIRDVHGRLRRPRIMLGRERDRKEKKKKTEQRERRRTGKTHTQRHAKKKKKKAGASAD